MTCQYAHHYDLLPHFKIFKPTRRGFNHCHAGETTIILNYISDWMLLSYTLFICTYKVYMHRILQYYLCKILEWKTSIKSISLFEMLTYLARLSIHLYLRDKVFSVSYPPGFFSKSTTGGVVEIEMVPI